MGVRFPLLAQEANPESFHTVRGFCFSRTAREAHLAPERHELLLHGFALEPLEPAADVVLDADAILMRFRGEAVVFLSTERVSPRSINVRSCARRMVARTSFIS